MMVMMMCGVVHRHRLTVQGDQGHRGRRHHRTGSGRQREGSRIQWVLQLAFSYFPTEFGQLGIRGAVLSLAFQAQVDAVLGLLWQIEAFIYSFGGSRWVQGLVSA